MEVLTCRPCGHQRPLDTKYLGVLRKRAATGQVKSSSEVIRMLLPRLVCTSCGSRDIGTRTANAKGNTVRGPIVDSQPRRQSTSGRGGSNLFRTYGNFSGKLHREPYDG